jgi:hypothetical protein
MFVGAFLFGLSMCFTSCEDILGKWEKPVPQVPETVVEEVKVLGEALEAGATVTINYTVGTESYTATFQKNSDDTYTLISNTAVTPAPARALTRYYAPTHNVPTGDGATIGSNIKLELVGNKLVLTVKSTDGISLFEAQMNVDGGEVIVFNTNAGNLDCTIGAVSINDQEKEIKNPEMHSVIINSYPIKYAVKYSEGETWADVVDRYKNNESVEITTTTDGYISVKFSKEIVVEAFMTDGASEEEAENNYNTYFSGSFYLTERGLNARAMTRAIDPPTYVKATDAVDAHDTYYLIPVPVALSAVSTSHIGWVIGSDGKAYADIYYIPVGTTAVAMIAYVGSGSNCEHGLAIQLNSSPEQKDWANAKTYAEVLTAVPGGTWRLPSKADWQNMFLGCAISTDASSASDSMDHIAGFKEKIAEAGVTWQSGRYWSSTPSTSSMVAWDVDVNLDGDYASASFYEDNASSSYNVLGCLAF